MKNKMQLTFRCLPIINELIKKNRHCYYNNTLKEYDSTLRKRLRIRSVISVNYHYITLLCPFNLLIRFKCNNIV